MAHNKVYKSAADAVADIPDGATIMVGGFAGPAGAPQHLLRALRAQGTKELTIIATVGGFGLSGNGFGSPKGYTYDDHDILVDNRQVRKLIASYPYLPSASMMSASKRQFLAGELEVEMVPMGTLAERIRAGGAGIAAFYIKVGAGTEVAEGKDVLVVDGEDYIREYALKADYALIRAAKADGLGNLVYRGTSRNMHPIMATAAKVTIVEVEEIVATGELNPEHVVTPFVYVDRIVEVGKDQ